MHMATDSKDIADLLLEWYRKGRENGTIPEPTKEDKRRGEELATRLVEWGRRQKEKENVKTNLPSSKKVVVKKKKLPRVVLEKEPVIELGRIHFKGASTLVYLPKSVCKALNLDRKVNSSFVIVADGSNSILLIKDVKVAERLRPMVLEARKAAFSIKMNQNNFKEA
jgi:hypothetical protein